jgi:hypothetical protein
MQPRFPQEVVEEIIDWVGVGSVGQRDPHLGSCSLVAGNWVRRSQQHLFYSVELASTTDISNWITNIRPGVGGVSGHVKKLWLNVNWDQWSRRFPSVEHLKSFTHVEELRLTYWCGGRATREEVEEGFGGFGPSVRSLSVSLPRGDTGSFLHLLSLFPHLDNLSIWTSCLDESLDPLPRYAVTVRGRLVLDGAQEHFADALIGSGLRPKVLKISIPRSISYDGLLAACAPNVEIVSISPTFGQCLAHFTMVATADFGQNRGMSRSYLPDLLHSLEARGDQVDAPRVLLRGRSHDSAADPVPSPREGDV